MKAVLISIRPKWCELIANGQKTIEVRKTRPKIETPFKCYIYCTVGKGNTGDILPKSGIVCGKVIGEFVCDEIEELDSYFYECAAADVLYENIRNTCLSWADFNKYSNGREFLYGWHISDLKIYDKPRELSEFTYWLGFISDGATDNHGHLKRAPQSWMYVEEV